MSLTSTSPSTQNGESPTSQRGKTIFLPEIQALRALAVLLVVVYHLWPGRVPGGFIGVDVFFVISGFLITGHLARPLLRGERVQVLRFWSNRIWRLLPASLFVLLVCFLVTVVWAPVTVASDALRQIGASAAYVINWILAIDAVDYLAADNTPTLVQHYWSLSVEEQFYVLWPLLLGVAAALAAGWARRTARSVNMRRVLTVTIVVVVLASLIYSIVTTASHPQRAYFDTFTRVWEFGLGGVLALVLGRDDSWVRTLRSSPAVARFAAPTWIGLALVVGSALLMDGTTPFPSYWALIPVMGTLLVILGGDPQRGFGLPALYRTRPVQLLGDISYSFYLWHWPLIVWFALAMGRRHGFIEGVLIGFVAVLLAWGTKLIIEDPLRRIGRKTRRTWPAFLLALLAAVALIVASTTVVQMRETAAAAAAAERQDAVVDPTGCLGANATLGTSTCPTPFDLTPGVDPVLPYVDLNPDWCLTWFDQEWLSCDLGDPEGSAGTIALVGDSHAASLTNPMGDYFADKGWRVVSFTRYGCPALSATAFGLAGQAPAAEEACAAWTQRVTDELVKRSDIDVAVYTSFEQGYSYPEIDGAVQLTAENIEETLATVAASGKDVVLLRDFPATSLVDIPTCVASSTSPKTDCSVDLATAFPATPQSTAVAVLGDRIRTIDMREASCDDSRCYSLVGDVIMYADNNHVSQTFAQSLMPFLGPRIVDPSTAR